jgi:hypothetical protein
LEGGGCVGKSKRNHVVLKGARFAAERCLPFISLLDTNQMVRIGEVKASTYKCGPYQDGRKGQR